MSDNDYNIIKPVENLQNIGSLTPAKRREERKRRQNLHEQNEEKPKQESNKPINEEDFSDKLTESDRDQHSIDYCA